MTSAPPPDAEDHFGETAVGFKWTEGDSRDDRWQQANIGPVFAATVAHPGGPTLKGIVVRVGDKGEGAVCYDTELLCLRAAWTGGFLQFTPARFGLISPPAMQGEPRLTSPKQPGWSRDGSFHDPRSKPFGPLPRDVARLRGQYRVGERVVLEYTVGEALIRESPWLQRVGEDVCFTRTFHVSPTNERLVLSLGSAKAVSVAGSSDLMPARTGDVWTLAIPPSPEPRHFKVALSFSRETVAPPVLNTADIRLVSDPAPVPTEPERTITRGVLGENSSAYVLDTLTLPYNNADKALLFCSGHDFLPNGDALVCTVHGDVWRVSGIDDSLETLTWARFATGLFQPLGLKVTPAGIYVLGRDQLTRLHDRNRDGTADFYETINNEAQVTANAHEFATCLETDRAGNFYFLKGDSGSQTDHDGCLLRISPDGAKLDVVATGFRNANGLAIGPDDVITVAPQEGNWTPASALFQVTPGGFYGAMQSHHRPMPPADYEKPLCWIPRLEDNSSGGQVWTDSDRWGPLGRGHLLHLSFGTCRMFLVPREASTAHVAAALNLQDVNRGQSAGTVAFPLDFASGVMRGRFRSRDGQLYVTGLKGWVSRAVQDGCFQRVRYTGKPVDMPVEVETYRNGLALTFTAPLDKAEAENPDNYHLQRWNYRWSAEYGSPELKFSQPVQHGRDEVDVLSATLFHDGRTVFLELPDFQPVMQLAVGYALKSADGRGIAQTLNLTVTRIGGTEIPPDRLTRRPRPGQLPESVQQALAPGLLARFRTARSEAWSDARVLRMAALHVAVGESPSALTAAGAFEFEAEGFLHVPLRGRYAFVLAGTGSATLEVNGEVVAELKGDTLAPAVRRWDARQLTVPLHRGHNALRLRYRSPASGPATLRAFWVADGFAIEPIPPTALFANSADPLLSARDTWRTGQAVFAEHRCLRCHERPASDTERSLPAWEAPRLDELATRLEPAWVYHWLLDPRALHHDAVMPTAFDSALDLDRQAAADLTAWLTRGTKPAPQPASSDELVEQGLALYESLGCIGCHRFTAPGEADPLDRVSLHFVTAKFHGSTLEAFLEKPHARYSQSRMPDFQLPPDEARAIAAYLRLRGTGTLAAPPKGDPRNGPAVASERGCRTCHALSDTEPATATTLRLRNTTSGCLAEDEHGRAPRLALTPKERGAVRQFLERPVSRRSTAEASAAAFERLKCQVCHPRDGRPAQRLTALAEDSELGLPPEQFPNLTWTGERLQAGWLTRFLSGDIPQKPRPWLKGRMPRFPAAQTLAIGLAAEHGLPPVASLTVKPDERLVPLGARLIEKDGGLDCRQCHAVGTKPATGDQATHIALGINFALAKDRILPEFYERFVRDPPRYDPGTRMPILIPDGRRTAATAILDGDADRQLEALWHFLQSVHEE